MKALVRIMKRATKRVDVLPLLPIVFGLGEIEAAAAIGISASKFRELIKDGRMPRPRRIGGRSVWDVDELRAAFKALPRDGESEKADTWADVGWSGWNTFTHSVIALVVCAITSGVTESGLPFQASPGSSEFMNAYATLLSDRPKDVVERRAAALKSFAALAIRYYGSPQYQSLCTSSRTNYRRVIDGFLEQHGHRRVDQMTREHVDVVIDKMASKPGAGIILLKRIRTLVRYGTALGWTDRDPTAGVKGYKSKEIHTWSEDEISIFEKRWLEGTRERLTFALLLYTGQRGSDVYRMTWGDIVGGAIRVAQQKTAAKLAIPIHGALHRVLSLAKRDHASILVTSYGEQFSVKGFGQMVSAAIQEAGLPVRCKAHGLRKAAARRLAEAGCSASEIAAITGHKTLAEVERYTRAADQERLARQAIQRQSENRSGKLHVDRVANTTDDALEINSLVWKMALPRGIEPLFQPW
jgi:integrase/predicted DNA-binding transcriptional regulator AlpA